MAHNGWTIELKYVVGVTLDLLFNSLEIVIAVKIAMSKHESVSNINLKLRMSVAQGIKSCMNILQPN